MIFGGHISILFYGSRTSRDSLFRPHVGYCRILAAFKMDLSERTDLLLQRQDRCEALTGILPSEHGLVSIIKI